VKKWLFFLILIMLYCSILSPFCYYQQKRVSVEKVGFLPSASMIKLFSGDQSLFLGAWIIGKAVSYYGGLYQQPDERIISSADYEGIYRALNAGLNLDPYNMDGYYFAQATLVWDMKRVNDANKLLERGLKFRSWDFYLPYFLGFNNAFFLKDFDQAAKYYKRVAELTGGDLSMRLTGRYLYEAGKTDLAISYLSTMVQSARNEAVKKTLELRLTAFKAVRDIEQAYAAFVVRHPNSKPDISMLVSTGFLKEVPVDPYGGHFYINEKGKVVTTSKFAFAHMKKN